MSKRSRVADSFLLIVILCCMVSGCATLPKPKTVGETIGAAIDHTIAWSSRGIQTILNK